MEPQRWRQTVCPECCGDSLGWFDAEAMQYNPEIGFAFVNAPVTNRLAVLWLLAMRYSDELKRHQVGFTLDFLTTNLNGRASIQARVVGPRARV
jgi:hypothetical protein